MATVETPPIRSSNRYPLVVRRKLPTWTYTEVSQGMMPGRGLVYSLIVHEIIVFCILCVPVAIRNSYQRNYRYRVERWIPLEERHLIYYLPAVGGGSPSSSPEGGGGTPAPRLPGNRPLKPPRLKMPAPPSATLAQNALVYPAPQPVVSNPVRPTNRIQTILQPEIPNAPTLNVPLALPNVVKLGKAHQLATPPPLVPKTPKLEYTPSPPPEAPKLQADLRPRAAVEIPNAAVPPLVPKTPQLELTPSPPPEAPQLRGEPQPQSTKIAMPSATPPPKVPNLPSQTSAENAAPAQAPNLALPGGGGKDEHSLLVMSPIPGPPQDQLNVPPGEARGQFAMGPEANLKGSAKVLPGGGGGNGAAGSTKNNPEGGSAAKGEANGAPGGAAGPGGAANAAAGPGTGAAAGEGTGAGGPGKGGGEGSGVGAAKGPGHGEGPGGGHGAGPGGQGTGTGPGTGAGNGPGTGAFPGISITGGSGGNGTQPSGKPNTPPTNRAYGMTIVSTASSGGGLRDYGVFHNESVYTVYIEMTHSPTPAPPWTFQFAPLHADPPGQPGQVHVIPPFPIDKEKPQFPQEIVARNVGRMVVVYAEVTAEGKVQNLRMIQSPNPLLNPPLLEALAKWTFRPAELNGAPIAVKALFGIRLSLPPKETK